MKLKFSHLLFVPLIALLFSSCASQDLENENRMLKSQLAQMEQIRQADLARLAQQKNQELAQTKQQVDELAAAQKELENTLRDELASYKTKLEMTERGLVVTFLDEILFDSGKAEVRTEAYQTLDKLINVLQNEVKEHNIAIEGHTDNEPIRHSGWKSNWELSSARALEVLHYFQDKGIHPRRLSGVAYGEYHPVAANTTADGRRQNRRVEVVILPSLQKTRNS